FRSSLSNVLIWNGQQNSGQRTTVLSAGVQKSFTANPGSFLPNHHTRIIEGRVFRDNNINGTFNQGEPGIAGVEVRLEDGEAAITDELGRYKFTGVSADQHQVSIDLAQFHLPIRMTTRSEFEVDLIQQRVAISNFGVLDFARVMGNVYNDLRFEGHRQTDSRGMQDIQLLLDDGKQVRKAFTSGSGDFEIDNVPPGDYRMTIDPSSLPANYITPVDTFSIHVTPVSTVVQDVGMRALRSISGRVLLKVSKNTAAEGSTLVPVAGVEISANHVVAKTDANGNFLLRNLPAGKLSVTIVPAKPIPDGIKLPSGEVNLPADPIQVQGATIVITNPELLPFLPREVPAVNPGAVALPAVAADANSSHPMRDKAVAPATSALPNNASRSVPSMAAKPQAAPPAIAVTALRSDVPKIPDLVMPPITPLLRSVASVELPPTVAVVFSHCCDDPSLSLGEVAKCYREHKQPQAIADQR